MVSRTRKTEPWLFLIRLLRPSRKHLSPTPTDEEEPYTVMGVLQLLRVKQRPDASLPYLHLWRGPVQLKSRLDPVFVDLGGKDADQSKPTLPLGEDPHDVKARR